MCNACCQTPLPPPTALIHIGGIGVGGVEATSADPHSPFAGLRGGSYFALPAHKAPSARDSERAPCHRPPQTGHTMSPGRAVHDLLLMVPWGDHGNHVAVTHTIRRWRYLNAIRMMLVDLVIPPVGPRLNTIFTTLIGQTQMTSGFIKLLVLQKKSPTRAPLRKNTPFAQPPQTGCRA